MDDDLENISISCELNSFTINPQKIQSITQFILKSLGLADYTVSLRFVHAPSMKELNQKYRGKDRSTDVLSFPQIDWPAPHLQGASVNLQNQPKLLGDIVISLDDAAENAKNIGQELTREVSFLLVHGILHLCGHDHEEKQEEELMLTEQKKLISLLESSAKPPPWVSSIKEEPQ